VRIRPTVYLLVVAGGLAQQPVEVNARHSTPALDQCQSTFWSELKIAVFGSDFLNREDDTHRVGTAIV